MDDGITFTLDGREVSCPLPARVDLGGREARAAPASRTSATPTRRATAPDGNCRACMVEIEGERVLAAVLHPHGRRQGMVVPHRGRARRRRRGRW